MEKLETLWPSSVLSETSPETVQPTNQEMKPLDRTKPQQTKEEELPQNHISGCTFREFLQLRRSMRRLLAVDILNNYAVFSVRSSKGSKNKRNESVQTEIHAKWEAQ